METLPPADRLIHALAARRRVIMLGGMAIIAHGLGRKTKDIDVWLEPMGSSEEWAAFLAGVISEFDEARFWSLARRGFLESSEVADEIRDHGVLRVSGLDRDVDVFRDPNELSIDDFDQVWSDYDRELEGGVRLPSEVDLYLTKANTGREQDVNDLAFLESKIKNRYRKRLPVCDLAEAESLLNRFLDPEILQSALQNPNHDVCDLALKHLREFESEGDPYSRDILAAWKHFE